MTPALRRRLAERRPGFAYSIGRTLAIYSGLMVTIFLAALDQTVVVTALPAIVSDLGGLTQYPWVFGAFLLCQTISIPIYGRLGDVYGRRRLFFVSIPIFLIGSALCGLAQSMPELIAFRGLQGLGAGGVLPLAMATTGEIVPPRERGRFAALISSVFAAASVLGPTIGGLIVDNASWRWIFYLNLPVGGLALLVIGVTMPNRPRKTQHRIDYGGALLLTGTTSALLLALLWGGQTFPWASPEVGGSAVAAVILGIAFVRRTRRIPEPILPLGVARDRIVAAASIGTGLSVMCMFGATAFVPLFVQGVIGGSATSSGVVLIPQTLGAVVATIVTGIWVSHTGRYRGNALLGPLVMGAGMLLLSRIDTGTTKIEVAAFMVMLGIGAGMMFQTFTLAAQSSVPQASIGAATSTVQFSRAIGTTLGVAIFGAIVNHGLPTGLRNHGASVHRLAPAGREALAHALRPPFLLGAGLCAAVFATVWFGLEEKPLRATVEEPSIAAVAPTSGE